ncbi:hypothetical protein FACS1894159_10700 [Bacteroidia bacterium]|nr:hypothetical protein FACS1894159_10700 [Bacteroidia bacterium]
MLACKNTSINMKITLLYVALLLCSTLAAQPRERDKNPRDKIREVQTAQIISRLQLDEKRGEQFRAIYTRYFAEMSGNEKKLGQEEHIPADSISNEQAERLIRRELEIVKNSIRIREKYYEEFRTILSPSEIYRMYNTERMMRRRIMQETSHRTQPVEGQTPNNKHK